MLYIYEFNELNLNLYNKSLFSVSMYKKEISYEKLHLMHSFQNMLFLLQYLHY